MIEIFVDYKHLIFVCVSDISDQGLFFLCIFGLF